MHSFPSTSKGSANQLIRVLLQALGVPHVAGQDWRPVGSPHLLKTLGSISLDDMVCFCIDMLLLKICSADQKALEFKEEDHPALCTSMTLDSSQHAWWTSAVTLYPG